MKQRTSFINPALRALCVLFALFFLLAALPGLAAQQENQEGEPPALIRPVGFGRTRLALQKDGTFARGALSNAKVGQVERFAVALISDELAPSGEEATVRIVSEGYDFSKCEPVLLIPVDNVYYARKLTDYFAEKDALSATVRVEYLGVNKDAPVYLYISPKKTADEPDVHLSVRRKSQTAFAFGQSIAVGDYTIEKQGGGMPVEVALGMANMDEGDTVYLISDEAGKEVLRLVIHHGEVYGIAIKDNGIVVSLEYNFKSKAYASVISGKPLVKKDTVVDVFRQLGVSFTNPPDEDEWLKQQNVYETNRGFRIVNKEAKQEKAKQD